jgi:hypothetical protein
MAPSKRVSAAAQEQARKKSRTSAGQPEGIKGEPLLLALVSIDPADAVYSL